MTRETVFKLVEEAADELLPIIGKAVQGLLNGTPPDKVLSAAEVQLIADLADKRLDAALGHKPVIPGTGV